MLCIAREMFGKHGKIVMLLKLQKSVDISLARDLKVARVDKINTPNVEPSQVGSYGDDTERFVVTDKQTIDGRLLLAQYAAAVRQDDFNKTALVNAAITTSRETDYLKHDTMRTIAPQGKFGVRTGDKRLRVIQSQRDATETVSYTHLTLPTIYSV